MNETLIIDENRLFAPVQVGPTRGFAHIDTGARQSSILQTYTGNFANVGSREFQGAFGTGAAAQVHLDEIRFLGRTFRDRTADVQPDAVGGLNSLPFAVTMALGCDVLLQQPLYLNFAQREIGFLDDEAPQTKALARLDADFSLGLPLFEVSLGSDVLHAGFDTGAALCVLNQRLLGKLQDALTADQPLSVDDATGATHLIPTYTCSALSMGAYALGACRCLVIDISAIEQKAGRSIDFVFGLNAMMGHSWVVNEQQGFIDLLK